MFLFISFCSIQTTLQEIECHVKGCHPKKVFSFKFSEYVWNYSYISRKRNFVNLGFLQKDSKRSDTSSGSFFLTKQLFSFLLFEMDISCILVVAFSEIWICSGGNVFWKQIPYVWCIVFAAGGVSMLIWKLYHAWPAEKFFFFLMIWLELLISLPAQWPKRFSKESTFSKKSIFLPV